MSIYELTARGIDDPGRYMSLVAGVVLVNADSPQEARDIATATFIIARERCSRYEDSPSPLWGDPNLSDIRVVGDGDTLGARVISPEGYSIDY